MRVQACGAPPAKFTVHIKWLLANREGRSSQSGNMPGEVGQRHGSALSKHVPLFFTCMCLTLLLSMATQSEKMIVSLAIPKQVMASDQAGLFPAGLFLDCSRPIGGKGRAPSIAIHPCRCIVLGDAVRCRFSDSSSTWAQST